jgi:alpha-tubulin suppressor-like RCC1 family protein
MVVSIAASKYFSAAVTQGGEVWTFGADYNGALGSESSWSTSAQRVTGQLAERVRELGGAVQVAAGSTFCACLTANGKVLVWGKLGGGAPGAPGLFAASGRMVEVVVGLPKVTAIAAGKQHLLMTDGKRVWGVGKWVDSAGKEAGAATWECPEELLHVKEEQGGVKKIVAGGQSSAVVTGDGQLYMWGWLLDRQHAERLLGHAGGGGTEDGKLLLDKVDWGWAGFGGPEPRLVEGVCGVKDVALGGWHALVLVD